VTRASTLGVVACLLVACAGEAETTADPPAREGDPGLGDDATVDATGQAGEAAPATGEAAPGDGAIRALDWGEALFADPTLSPSEFNVFSCATCHPTREDDAATIATDLRDTAFRKEWWGGGAARLLDAVNFCLVYFMRGDPLDEADVRGRALYEYLVSISPTRPAPALPMSFVEEVPIPRDGDATRGEGAYATHCRGCHGEPHTGDGRIGGLVVAIPEGLVAWARAEGERYGVATVPVAPLIVDKIRHGQFFGVGGNMPFFTREILSDAEVADIVAYLGY